MMHVSGHYLYVDGASGTFGTVAQAIGPTLQACSSSCQIQFYYHMNGNGMTTGIRLPS